MKNPHFWFWVNLFIGGGAGALGSFAIGMMVGAGWMFYWPVSIKVVSGVGLGLATIAGMILKRQANFMHDFVAKQVAERYARKDVETIQENSAQ